MFKLVTLAALIAIAAADVSHIYNPHNSFGSPHSAHYKQLPPPPPPPVHHQSYSGGSGAEIPILRHESNIQEDGSYQYAYETGNGIAAQESGSVPDGTVAQGSYSFTSPEGEQVQVQYVADTNGFQPSGSHVPEIPAAIQRSLAWNAAHPEQPHAQNYGQVPHRRF